MTPENPSRAPESLLGGGWPADVENPRPIRTFTPRYRVSDLTRERMDTLLPRYAVEQLPVDPQAVFGRVAPLVLEIGSGHGAAAIGYAAAHPGHDVLTAEVHLPGVVRMLAAAQASGVENLRVYPRDAMDLLGGGLAPHTVSAVHLLFPDPWPKVRHAKRRFVQQRTLAAIERILVPGGELLVGTDHPVYAHWTREQLAAFPTARVTQVERPAWKDEDGFEGKGRAAGRPPTYLRVTFG
ncbi:tRNA (guanine(46)-N(7))-methyltransferase TrmB [Nostocoides australiense]|uniref:tRNA (guanine-N(7)-)-methyltransferase n=1 Tax=Nostocoides australiense Ben110 TaxID=1193182 RepID=W6JT54_9MICO|nr:hypothetical protein [Tetrasphaera australiensis]CCH71641.1 tRNA (guanine-N(7)-)-methyltransferase [Tetrasphaera australiensis Ben110]HPF80358.1 tRNA (guanosine(46)-N7)-methyltransferase TrmB [Tetrasphaera australiensis]HRW02442.1 tRNA (guanosine(46)-N7)-methyltransferase TrmB [Tetrasphaera sp.]